MFLSKRPTNGVYYLFFTDELGKRKGVSTRCKLKADAVKFLRQFNEVEHEKRMNLSRVSLSQFKQTYLEHSNGVHTARTRENCETAFNMFEEFVGDMPLHQIGIKEIETFLAKRKEKRSAWNARNYYIVLSAAFETAKRWGNILDNPFRKVAKPKVPELVPLFLTRPDFAELMKKIDDRDFKELVVTAVSTGMRLGELQHLGWNAIDLATKTIAVTNTEQFTTKNRRCRTVPMTENLFIILLARKERATNETELVFHQSGCILKRDYVSKTFKRYVVDAGLDKKLHFHSLRHTFASWLAQDGVSLYTIQKFLGHSSSSVTQIYSHLQPEQLHATVNRLNLSLN